MTDLMSFEATRWLAELRNNRDDADVTLNCNEEAIMAHSLILKNRSEYFKTALNTSVGTNKMVLKVEECSSHVLATLVDFIYGIGIPKDFSSEDTKSLLAMADLYLMEDLKGAVGSLIASKHINKDSILEISRMAEKYSAQKLKELCCEFIFKNLKILDNKMLMEMHKDLPLIGERAWLELVKKGNAQNSNEVRSVNMPEHFRRRYLFNYDDEYKEYVMANIRPNMLVLGTSRGSFEGNIGRVISFDSNGVQVKWSKTNCASFQDFNNFEFISPPIPASLLND